MAPSASAPPFRVPVGAAAARTTASAMDPAAPQPPAPRAVTPARRGPKQAAAAEAPAEATPHQERPASRAARRGSAKTTARAPKAVELTTVSSPRRSAAQAPAERDVAPATATPLAGGLRLTRLPKRGVTAVRVPAEGEPAQRTRKWYREHAERVLHTSDALELANTNLPARHTTAYVALGEHAAVFMAARSLTKLGAPRCPSGLTTVPYVFEGAHAVPDALRLRLHDAPPEWGVWIARNAARLRGHPRFDPAQEPLGGIEYRPALLYIPPGDAADILEQPIGAGLQTVTALGPLVALDISELPPATTEPAFTPA